MKDKWHFRSLYIVTQIVKFIGPTWGPPGTCRPQMGPYWPPWTLLSGNLFRNTVGKGSVHTAKFLWGRHVPAYQSFHLRNLKPRELPMPTTSSAVVTTMKQILSEHSISVRLISNNGGHLDSRNCMQFLDDCGIDQGISSPKSNEIAERFIETAKHSPQSRRLSDQYPAMLCCRTTPINSAQSKSWVDGNQGKTNYTGRSSKKKPMTLAQNTFRQICGAIGPVPRMKWTVERCVCAGEMSEA